MLPLVMDSVAVVCRTRRPPSPASSSSRIPQTIACDGWGDIETSGYEVTSTTLSHGIRNLTPISCRYAS